MMPISPRRASQNLGKLMDIAGYSSVDEVASDVGIEPMAVTNVFYGKYEFSLEEARAFDRACRDRIRQMEPETIEKRMRQLVIFGYF